MEMQHSSTSFFQNLSRAGDGINGSSNECGLQEKMTGITTTKKYITGGFTCCVPL